jgi:hypothetical protein
MIFPRQLGTSRAIGIQSVIKRIRMRNPSNLIFQSFVRDQLRRMEHVKTADQAASFSVRGQIWKNALV